MSVRVTYDHELGVLKQDLKEMARMVESAIEQTFAAFEDQDYAARSMTWSGPLSPGACP